jgi:S1-C subfamily serine protease
MEIRGWLDKYRGSIAAVIAVLVLFLVAHAVSHPQTSPVAVSHAGLLASPSAANATSTATTTATSSPQTKTASTTVQSSTSATAVSVSTLQAQQLVGAGTNLLHSLVNIVCISSVPSVPSISGSGVIIDSRGIILTAAHVAQLFLLQDYLGPDKVTCIVRSGSPARRAYTAEPIYVSPSWIKANPDTLKTTSPEGTGQDDFAFIGITGTATSTPVPSSFPAIPLSQTEPSDGERVAIGSYGAEYLTGTQLNYDLYPILVFGAIGDIYTFAKTTIDLISVYGSAASQEGSSGGAMVNAQGQLVATITTSSVSGSIASRQLNALTVGYMRRSYNADTGQDLDSTLASESVPQLIADFRNESDQLGSILAQALNVHG